MGIKTEIVSNVFFPPFFFVLFLFIYHPIQNKFSINKFMEMLREPKRFCC